jgi:hypothetical protein
MTDSTGSRPRIFPSCATEPFESLAQVRARRLAQGTHPIAGSAAVATQLASLLLRRLAVHGPSVSVLRQLARLATCDVLAWSELVAPLAAAIRAIRGEARDPGVAAAIVSLERAVPPPLWEAAAANPNPAAYLPLTEDEELQLARAMLELVAREVTRFRTLPPGDDREDAVRLAATVPLYFWLAADAARRVADRRLRATLRDEVDRASMGIAYFSAFLRMEPCVAWHPAFSTVFDAESALRLAMGLSAADRT